MQRRMLVPGVLVMLVVLPTPVSPATHGITAGQIGPTAPPSMEVMVRGVWKHLLVERFKPYIETGRHRTKPR
jgi:hypothetical protein